MAAVSESRGLARDLLLYAAAISGTGAVLRSGEGGSVVSNVISTINLNTVTQSTAPANTHSPLIN